MSRPECLLIVDDHLINRDSLSKRLARLGFRTLTAESGQQALAIVSTEPVDLVLLDIGMPGMSGYEVLEALRKQPETAELPVIMVTAWTDSARIVEALESGANDYVTKPIDFPVVRARIDVQLARRRAELALRESEERYALAVRGANDGLWDWRLTCNEVYYSPRWREMLGLEETELSTSPDEWFQRVHEDDLEPLQAAVQAHRERRTPHFEHEHRMLHASGNYRWMLSRGTAVWDEAGRAVRMAGSLTDITEGKVADALTGLPNRILLLDRIGRALERKRRSGDYVVALLFVDLDRFKIINDSLGHAAGDRLLVDVAQRLEWELRASDTVVRPGTYHSLARLGGDEFAILIEDLLTPPVATRIAERIGRAIEEPFQLEGREIVLSASIGIAVGGASDQSPEALLADADIAMYAAKKAGGNRAVTFDARMRRDAVTRLQLEGDLRKAVDTSGLALHYQPIVTLQDGQVAGFEALIRWPHPQDGFICPDVFLPIAEDTGLIIPISLWVIRRACNQLALWRRQFPARDLIMSVNVSARHFIDAGLVEAVRRCLSEAGVPGHALHIEIVETDILSSTQQVLDLVAALRTLGVRISIDDFGTGYSSLSYLHRLEIDALKIDRSFVGTLGQSAKNERIIQSIVTLAHGMHLEVIAEGIETPEQLAYIRKIECRFGQGYLFARPLDAAAATVFLEGAQPAATA